MAYGYTGLGAISREGLLKKNPLIGKAFGKGASGKEASRQYQGLHDELRAGIRQGRPGAGQGPEGFRPMANRLWNRETSGLKRDVESARGLAGRYQKDVYRAEDKWNQSVIDRARLKGVTDWGEMLGMSLKERQSVKQRMTDAGPITSQSTAEERAQYTSDKKLLADDFKRAGAAGFASRQTANILQDYRDAAPALQSALAGSREALAYQMNKITGGEAELRRLAGLYNSFFGGY